MDFDVSMSKHGFTPQCLNSEKRFDQNNTYICTDCTETDSDRKKYWEQVGEDLVKLDGRLEKYKDGDPKVDEPENYPLLL